MSLTCHLCRRFEGRYDVHVRIRAGFAGRAATEAPFLPRVRDDIVAYIRVRRAHIGSPGATRDVHDGRLALRRDRRISLTRDRVFRVCLMLL